MIDEGPDFDRILPVHNKPLYSTIITEIKEELAQRGLFSAPPPLNKHGDVARPLLPPALSTLDRESVLDLLGQYAAYLEYVAPVVTDYAVQYDAWARTKTSLVSELRAGLRGSAAQVKDVIENDPRYRDIDQKEFRAKGLYTQAAAVEKGAEKSCAIVSRAITSQGQELERVGRENNVASNRRGAYSSPHSSSGRFNDRVVRPR